MEHKSINSEMYMYTNVHCSSICNQVWKESKCLTLDKWIKTINKYLYLMAYYSTWSLAICSRMEVEHINAKWNRVRETKTNPGWSHSNEVYNEAKQENRLPIEKQVLTCWPRNCGFQDLRSELTNGKHLMNCAGDVDC